MVILKDAEIRLAIALISGGALAMVFPNFF
jgi:hypothetical protein